jgi:hypothetical protein
MVRALLFAGAILFLTCHSQAGLPPPPTDLHEWSMAETPDDPGEASAADWIDAPAARLGPVVVRDGHFFTGPQRLKLWGVNLAFGANFPTHAEADRLAVRFRRFGINAVRFHHMDNQPFPTGIFADASLTTLSPEALDRLDYFISVLKAQGVYADLNLHVSRNYRHYHGVDGKDGPAVDKIVDLFDPVLIDAQKQYARDLLTHVNAYTHNAYAVEPGVAIVEINNENSLFMWGAPATIASLPEPYAAELKRQWNRWLAAKHKDDAAIKTAWAAGEERIGEPVSGDPKFEIPSEGKPKTWSAEMHQPAQMTEGRGPNGGVMIAVAKVDGTDWHLQFLQAGLALKKGQSYAVRFTAKADQPVTIGVGVSMAHTPWQSLGLGSTVKLTTEDQPFELAFTATGTDDNARLSFTVGGEVATITIASAELRPGGRAGLTAGQSPAAGSVDILTPRSNPTPARRDDWQSFLVDTERAYYTDMRQYLKTDLGVKCPITGTIGFGPVAVTAQSNMDFVDGHAYWGHPSFPHKQWDMSDWRIENTAMVDYHAKESTFAGLSSTRQPIRPFTITEYQHPAPNDWRAESLPMIATFAARQDWDGVFIFAYSHDSNYAKPKISSFFDIEGDPAKMSMMPAAARLFFGSLHPAVVKSYERKMENVQLDVWDRRTSDTSTSHGPGTGQFAVGDDRAGAFVGFGPVSADMGIARIDSLESPFASIVVSMRDPHEDDAILITAVARATNTGMEWDADRKTIGTHWGTTPVLIEPVRATISLAGPWKHAHPLDPAGKPLPDEVGTVHGDRFVVTLGGRPAVAYIVTK